jgi:hypothetical protein
MTHDTWDAFASVCVDAVIARYRRRDQRREAARKVPAERKRRPPLLAKSPETHTKSYERNRERGLP